MSVTSAKERRVDSRSYSEDDTGKRTYERIFVVQCSTATDGPTVLRAYSSLPQIGSFYTFSGDGSDANAICKRRKFKLVSSSDRIWEAVYEYDTETTDPEDDEGDDPLDWRPRFRQGVGIKRSVMSMAYNEGTADLEIPVANTAGDPFVPAPEFDQPFVIWWIERNETEHPDPAGQYVLSLNQSAFGSFPPGTVLLSSIGASREFHKSFAYWKITYELQFQPREPYWAMDLVSVGLRETGGLGGGVVKIFDKKSNTPVTKPVYLKQDGQQAASRDDAAELRFWPFPFVDWSILNLPNPYEPD